MADVAVKSEPLFGKKNRRLLTDPLNDNNPITVQVLGICSALAVTSTLINSLYMGVAVMVVTGFANLTISALRNYIPNRIRMIVQLVVIAFLVTLVSLSLQAFAYDVSKTLSVFVGLIITNCIVMGRLEAYAMANDPWPSFLDGIGNGLGYALILIGVGTIRELFASGTIFGLEVMGGISKLVAWVGSIFGWNWEWEYVNNGLMVLPISSIILIGVFIWIQRGWNTKLVDVS